MPRVVAICALVALSCSSPAARPIPAGEGECADCHAAIAAEWRSSRHAVAFTNAIFRREFDSRRTAWCVTCHAPNAADPVHVDDADPVARRGVDCVACHRRDGAMVSRTRSDRSPHDTQVDPTFGSPSYCARCHEFAFPELDESGMHVADTAVAMQSTVSEHEARGGGRGGCHRCHQRTPAGHAFPGSHDRGMLRRAVTLRAQWEHDRLAIEVRNRGAAHNVPTGGVHRHMIVRAWRSTAPERMFEAYIGRRFEPIAGGGKKKTFDSTIAPGKTRRWFVDWAALGGQHTEPVHVELRYVYVREGSGPLEEIEGYSRVIHSVTASSDTNARF